MDLTTCPHCQFSIESAASQKSPPWCRRCGGDLAARPIGSDAPAEELVALTAAAPATRPAASRWGNRPVAAGVEATAVTPAPVAETPAPTGRWANRRRNESPDARNPHTGRRSREAEVTHETFDYEAALQEAGYESTRPSLTCYAFAGLCLLLPVLGCVFRRVALFLGLSGAGACVKVAHSHGMPMPRRILTCVGIVTLTYGTYLALIVCLLGAAGGVQRAATAAVKPVTARGPGRPARSGLKGRFHQPRPTAWEPGG